jgi:hypothetical protein
MLRLDPSYPPVWRSATALQFGAEPVVILHEPQPWQLRVLRELERGIPDGAFGPFAGALGAPDAGAAARLLTRIGRALTTDAAPRRRLTLQCAQDVPDHQRDAVGAGLEAAGFDIETAHRFDPLGDTRAGAAAPVVFVVHRLVAPGAAAGLMSADIAHVAVALTGAGAEIGPFVEPGRTACLACVAAHRRDADPSWPAVAAQLLGRPVESEPSVLWEAGIVAGRLIAERARNPSAARTRSVTLRAGSLHRNVRSHRPHAECRCRSLGGTVTAAAPARLETTTETAFARPA